MGTLQKWLLCVLTLALVLVAVLTWGSIGSAALVFCLIMMGASLLYQHFLTNNDSDDYQME